jgi:hypothetical protein
MRHIASAATLALTAIFCSSASAQAVELDYALDVSGNFGSPFDANCVITRDDGTQSKRTFAGGPPRLEAFRAAAVQCTVSKQPSLGTLSIKLLQGKDVVSAAELADGPGEARLSAGIPLR